MNPSAKGGVLFTISRKSPSKAARQRHLHVELWECQIMEYYRTIILAQSLKFSSDFKSSAL